MCTFLLIVVGVVIAVALWRYSKPLTAGELQQLATKRRSKALARYFQHGTWERQVNQAFKSNMNGSGQFYPVRTTLSEFPSTAAGLLTYKKHEWVIIAFERGQVVESMWVNKGRDRASVTPYLSDEHLLNLARRGSYIWTPKSGSGATLVMVAWSS